jgi:hypothetical protein
MPAACPRGGYAGNLGPALLPAIGETPGTAGHLPQRGAGRFRSRKGTRANWPRFHPVRKRIAPDPGLSARPAGDSPYGPPSRAA